MNQAFTEMMRLVGAAVRGDAARPPAAERRSVLAEAQRQGCLLLAADALVRAEADGKPAESLRKLLLQNVSRAALRGAEAERVLRLLAERGIFPVLIKGDRLAQLYPNPLLRESVDTDLFFPNAKDAQTAAELLLSDGARLLSSKADGDIVLIHPSAGNFELHTRFFRETFTAARLAGESCFSEPPETLRLRNGTEVAALGPNDTMKQLFAHLLKHFLFDWFTVRQLADLLLYTRACVRSGAADLDEWRRFLRAVGQEPLFDAVMELGAQYLGFAREELFYTAEPTEKTRKNAELLAQDCFAGGAKGVGAGRGAGVAGARLEKSGKRRAAMRLAQLGRVAAPGRALLEHQFPYCKGKPLLLPAAWTENLVCVARGALSVRRRLSERAELFTRLGIGRK